MSFIRGDRLRVFRVFPCDLPPNLGSEKPWRSRSPQPGAPGRLKRVGWRVSGRLQLRPTGWRARRRPGLQTQVREDLLDHRLLQDRRDDLQLAPAVRAARHVESRTRASAAWPSSAEPDGGAHRAPRTRPAVRPARVVRALATPPAAPPAHAAWRRVRERHGSESGAAWGVAPAQPAAA